MKVGAVCWVELAAGTAVFNALPGSHHIFGRIFGWVGTAHLTTLHRM